MASSVAPNAAYPVPRRNPPLTVLAAVDIEDAAEDRDWKIIKNAYGAELSLAIIFSFPAQTLAFSYCAVFSRLKHTRHDNACGGVHFRKALFHFELHG